MGREMLAMVGLAAMGFWGCGGVEEPGDVPCRSASECAEGEFCDYGPNADDIEGVCRPYRVDGETCAAPIECGDGLVCDPEEGFCRAPLRQGDACTDSAECDAALLCNAALDQCQPPGEEGDVCGVQEDCQQPFVCNLAAGDPAICLLPAPEGDACATDPDCAGGLPCEAGFCGGPVEADPAGTTESKCNSSVAGAPVGSPGVPLAVATIAALAAIRRRSGL